MKKGLVVLSREAVLKPILQNIRIFYGPLLEEVYEKNLAFRLAMNDYRYSCIISTTSEPSLSELNQRIDGEIEWVCKKQQDLRKLTPSLPVEYLIALIQEFSSHLRIDNEADRNDYLQQVAHISIQLQNLIHPNLNASIAKAGGSPLHTHCPSETAPLGDKQPKPSLCA